MTKASDKVTSSTDDGTAAVTVTPGQEPAQVAADQGSAGDSGVDSNGVEENPPVDKLHVTMNREQRIAAGVCVVPDGESSTPHVGRAVNGLVCSAHAMHYDAQGRRRDQAPSTTVVAPAAPADEDAEVK